jgi:hypothetical protein
MSNKMFCDFCGEGMEKREEVKSEEVPYPNAQFIAEKLLKRGFTYDDLVKCLLWAEHSGPEDIYDDYLKRSVTVYCEIRSSITNFQKNIIESDKNVNDKK